MQKCAILNTTFVFLFSYLLTKGSRQLWRDLSAVQFVRFASSKLGAGCFLPSRTPHIKTFCEAHGGPVNKSSVFGRKNGELFAARFLFTLKARLFFSAQTVARTRIDAES